MKDNLEENQDNGKIVCPLIFRAELGKGIAGKFLPEGQKKYLTLFSETIPSKEAEFD